jgi:hypothetical protein
MVEQEFAVHVTLHQFASADPVGFSHPYNWTISRLMVKIVNGGRKMYQMAVEKCTTLVINIAPILGACQERFC